MGRSSWVLGGAGVRGLSLADKVVETTNPSSAVAMRERDENVFAGWHPGQGVYHLSTRTLRSSQLQGLVAKLEVVIPAFAALSSPRLSSAAPSTVTPSFLFNLFSPLTPPPCVWPTVLSLRPDPPACPLPDLPAALPSQAAASASPAPLAAAAICLRVSRPPGIARQDAADRLSQAAWRNLGVAGKPALLGWPPLPAPVLTLGSGRGPPGRTRS